MSTKLANSRLSHVVVGNTKRALVSLFFFFIDILENQSQWTASCPIGSPAHILTFFPFPLGCEPVTAVAPPVAPADVIFPLGLRPPERRRLLELAFY